MCGCSLKIRSRPSSGSVAVKIVRLFLLEGFARQVQDSLACRRMATTPITVGSIMGLDILMLADITGINHIGDGNGKVLVSELRLRSKQCCQSNHQSLAPGHHRC